MAKIKVYSGRIPKRILKGFVMYESHGVLIIREKSGFTKEALLHSAKYENCRKSSSEFGRVSKACKGIRLALEGILPKKNNLLVVNSLTKFMYSLLTYDTIHVRGERILATALDHEEGKRLFKEYSFNPLASIHLPLKVVNGQLEVGECEVPPNVSWLGIRLHVLAYDWETFTGTLYSGGWYFEQQLTQGALYHFPKVAAENTNLVFMVEVLFFNEKEGAFVPVRTEEKGIFVVDYQAVLPVI